MHHVAGDHKRTPGFLGSRHGCSTQDQRDNTDSKYAKSMVHELSSEIPHSCGASAQTLTRKMRGDENEGGQKESLPPASRLGIQDDDWNAGEFRLTADQIGLFDRVTSCDTGEH